MMITQVLFYIRIFLGFYLTHNVKFILGSDLQVIYFLLVTISIYSEKIQKKKSSVQRRLTLFTYEGER